MKTIYISIWVLLFAMNSLSIAQETSIRSYRPEIPIREASLLPTSPTVPQTVVYLDGLGRELQTVWQAASPGGEDIVQPLKYDAFGRPDRDYLRFAPPSGSNPGAYRPDFEAEHAAFYQENFSDPYGYTESVFEASALLKPLAQSPPGKAWQPGSGREIRFHQRPNLTEEQVRIWTLDAEGLPKTKESYKAGELWVNTITDAEGHRILVYTDKLGREILKKTQAADKPSKAHTGWYCTYYVYDILGDLRAVLPPKAVEILDGRWERSSESALADGMYFLYRFDGQKRLIEKKSPGKAIEQFLYDQRDRLIGSRDGNLEATGQWLYTHYDAHNRPVQTGIVTDERDRETLQELLDAQKRESLQELFDGKATPLVKTNPESGWVPSGQNINSVSFDGHERYAAGQNIVLKPGFHFVTKGNRNFAAGISTQPEKKATTGSFPRDEGVVLTLSYYDDYRNNKKAFREKGEGISTLPATGLATGKLVRDLSADHMLESAFHYDKMGRAVLTLSEDHLGGQSERSIKYDFRGRPLETQTHIQGAFALAYSDRYSYSPQGFLISVHRGMEKEPETLLATYAYGKTGELREKNPGGLAPFHLERNIRGWSTAIQPLAKDPTLFSLALSYHTGTRPLFNGNISGMDWKGRDQQPRQYAFDYDPAGRLKGAAYTVSGKAPENNRYSLNGISYDANGNILSLTRHNRQSGNSFGEVDRLSYRYAAQGNSLEGIGDAVPDAGFLSAGFSPSPSGGDYRYDANGNLIANPDKHINRIRYNHLDLPEEMVFASGEKLRIAYSAEGQLLHRILEKNGKTLHRTDRLGELVLTDGNPDHLLHREGRAVWEKGKWLHEYFIRDHLGNIRQVLRKPVTSTVLASMEPGRRKEENRHFEGIDQNRQAGMEHNSSPGGSYSAWLNAYRGRILGPARMQQVEAGEQIRLSVQGKYRDDKNLSVKPEIFVSTGAKTRLLDKLTEFRNAPAAAGNPLLWLSLADLLIRDLQTKPVPEAYMLYALYDKAGKIYRKEKQALSKKAAGKHEFLEANFYIEKDGHLEAFLVNETESDVWFDDFQVQTQSALVVQEDHYDPWGLGLSGLEYRKEDRGESRYGFNGKEKLPDAGLNLYDFGARLFDPAIGRWMTVDPLADHQKQVDKSPYAAMWNNPILYNDPNGKCPECEEEVKKPYQGQVYHSTGGAEYVFGDGKWTREGGLLNVVEITKSRVKNKGIKMDIPSNLGNSRDLEVIRDFGIGADYTAGALGLAQAGILEYRRSLPLSEKIGTLNNFSRIYMGLGIGSRILGRVGYTGAGLGVYLDYKSMKRGEISKGRFSYRTGGLAVSIFTGASVGGPWGAAAGAAVGGVTIGAEYILDNMLVPLGEEINYQMWNFENAIKNGWYPGR
ncbi:DUF6443 domain-containing protein [Cyclobacterium plantarum]|uniref:DUF6443 domain-containing protein n=1 Tax=Cyclobacterium plantarum TaxID=2716263 RepID=UPI003F703748